MKLFKTERKMTRAEERLSMLDWMRSLTPKEYKSFLEIIEIYRDADEQVAIIEAGSKKAYLERMKDDDTIDSLLLEVGE